MQALAPGASILDAAAGIGVDALTLCRRGYRVTVADASPAMLAQAQARLDAAGADVPLVHSTWLDLPEKVPGPFDAVIVTGNALASVRGAAGRRAAIEAFSAVLAESGRLLIDTHDWERLVARGNTVVADPAPLARDGTTCVRVFRWQFSELPFTGPADLEVVLTFHRGSTAWVEAYPVQLWPFTARALQNDLADAGLATVWTDAGTDPAKYSTLAARPASILRERNNNGR